MPEAEVRPTLTPQQAAEREELQVKEWSNVIDALESCTFHGRYAGEISRLIAISKHERKGAKARLDEAVDKIKHPVPEWKPKTAESVSA